MKNKNKKKIPSKQVVEFDVWYPDGTEHTIQKINALLRKHPATTLSVDIDFAYFVSGQETPRGKGMTLRHWYDIMEATFTGELDPEKGDMRHQLTTIIVPEFKYYIMEALPGGEFESGGQLELSMDSDQAYDVQDATGEDKRILDDWRERNPSRNPVLFFRKYSENMHLFVYVLIYQERADDKRKLPTGKKLRSKLKGAFKHENRRISRKRKLQRRSSIPSGRYQGRARKRPGLLLRLRGHRRKV